MALLQIDAYPCAWPENWTRTHISRRENSHWRQSFTQACALVNKELQLLGALESVISTNIQIRRDGTYAAVPEPSDPAVAVYWVDRHRSAHVVACDQWHRVRENMRAIGFTLQALHQIERLGCGQLMAKSYEGFTLPRDTCWRGVFGMPRHWAPTLDELATRHRSLLAQIPPHSNDTEFTTLQDAFERAQAECGESTRGQFVDVHERF